MAPGLVEQQEHRIVLDGECELEPLLHPARIGAHPVVGARREPDALETAIGDRARRGEAAHARE